MDVKTKPASCGKNDGSMTVAGKGGTDRYPVQFKLNDGPLQTSSSFRDLSPGTYKLTIQVARCFGTIDVTIGQQPTPVISAIDSVPPRCGENNGSLRIAAFGGSGNLAYALNGTDFSSNNRFDLLAGGPYMVTVRDDSLCSVSMRVTLKKSVALRLNAVDVEATSCGQPNGSIQLPLANGNGIISFSVTGHGPQTAKIFNNLAAGRYEVEGTDEDGCRDSVSVLVNDSQGPVISNIKIKQPSCDLSDGQLTISSTGPGYHLYSLDAFDFTPDSLFSQLPAGSYLVMVKDDAGCLAKENIGLGEPCSKTFFLPSAFTPNDDGINDTWQVFFSAAAVEIEDIKIFNRWGEVVYAASPGSVGSGTAIWDGTSKGRTIQGVFTYKNPYKKTRASSSGLLRSGYDAVTFDYDHRDSKKVLLVQLPYSVKAHTILPVPS